MLGTQARQPRQPLVPLGVVLHRARAKRIEIGVDRHVERREVRVMPDHIELAQLGQRRAGRARGARRGISSSSGRSGTSDSGKMAVARPGRLDSKSSGVWSSLYMNPFLSDGPTARTGLMVRQRTLQFKACRIGLGQTVDLGAGALLGDGDQDAVGEVRIPPAQSDAAVVAEAGRPRRAPAGCSWRCEPRTP